MKESSRIRVGFQRIDVIEFPEFTGFVLPGLWRRLQSFLCSKLTHKISQNLISGFFYKVGVSFFNNEVPRFLVL